ncbi:unnamed protein product [Urochloa humidicola]
MDDAMEKVFRKINDLSKKMDVELSAVRQEQGRLSTSINNVQTQVLANKGRFDSSSSSGGGNDGDRGAPPAPGPKFCYPKYDSTDDPLD